MECPGEHFSVVKYYNNKVLKYIVKYLTISASCAGGQVYDLLDKEF